MPLDFKYSFPAIKGQQANNEYYVAMCPFKIISRIFTNAEGDIPPEFRAQRTLNRSRIPEITNYILDNPNNYVFSSLTVSVDGVITFLPYSNSGLGILDISMDAKFLINDGQHRRSAIEEALKVNPSLEDETISIVFFKDKGLKRSQQMFADLNKHAINTTKSIGILYDNRDPLSLLSKKIVNIIPIFRQCTDKEVDNLSKYSPKLFTLANIYNATACILSKKKGEAIEVQHEQFVIGFWTSLSENIYEWKQVQKKSLSASECRRNYINAHGVILIALGHLGNYFYQNTDQVYTDYIRKLDSIDWSRGNYKDWIGRAITTDGKININTTAIKLCCNRIKMLIGIGLNADEEKIEITLKKQIEGLI